MNSITNQIGYNFRLARGYLGLTQSFIANKLGINRQTLIYFEKGHGKYVNEERAKNYFNVLSSHERFPEDLHFEDFMYKDLSDYFMPAITEKYPEYFGSDDIMDEIPTGLQDFLNDKIELAVANPTQEEIEILTQLNPLWNADKDFYRSALGYLRRSRNDSKHKAAGDNHQSSNG